MISFLTFRCGDRLLLLLLFFSRKMFDTKTTNRIFRLWGIWGYVFFYKIFPPKLQACSIPCCDSLEPHYILNGRRYSVHRN